MSAEQLWEENPEVVRLEDEAPDVLTMSKVLRWRQVPGFPENWRQEHLHRLFTKHPRLRGTEAAHMAESLYEGWTWNA